MHLMQVKVYFVSLSKSLCTTSHDIQSAIVTLGNQIRLHFDGS